MGKRKTADQVFFDTFYGFPLDEQVIVARMLSEHARAGKLEAMKKQAKQTPDTVADSTAGAKCAACGGTVAHRLDCENQYKQIVGEQIKLREGE